MKHIIFKVKAVLLLIALCGMSGMLYAQQSVSGVVTDAGGSSLPGVNILEKGTTNGVTTNLDGQYSISVSGPDAVLEFRFIGFASQEVTVGARSAIDVVLAEDVKSLEEVVVIGYGTTTQKDATGSLTAISKEDFNQGNIVTPENLLNGRVAGLTVNTGGEPGAGSTIRIRGGASLGASNDPLIVINGLPIDNNTVGGARSILSSINPNEIESFTVLKDASAAAIYGSRASNGVIIITTKSAGRELRMTLDTQVGVNTLTKTLDVHTADEFRQVVTEQFPDLVDRLGDANTDWQDAIYQNGFTNNLNLAGQGVLLGVPTRLSIGRNYQEGLRLTSQFERLSGGLSLSPTFFEGHLKIDLNANGTLENNRFAGGQEGAAIRFDPTQPVYDTESPFGGFFQYLDDNGDDEFNNSDLLASAPFNPVAELLQRNNISTVSRVYGNLKFDYNFHFLPELTAVVNVGLDRQASEGSNTVVLENPTSQPDGTFAGSESNYQSEQTNQLLDSYFVYTRSAGNLNIEATGGYSYQKFSSQNYNSGELRNDLPTTEPITNIDTDLVLIGLFGRANLSIADTYLLTLSYRRDGTSRFSAENRWGNFPAVAFAWKLDEQFFPDNQTLSTFKLRTGWGITGQQDIGRGNADLFLERYVVGDPGSQYQFGNQVINVGLPQFRNEALKWEETTTINAGFDYGLFDDRITGSVEGFYKESRDLLAFAAISDGSNFSNSGFQNIGNFTSRGIEFAVNADLLTSENGFNWNVNFNTTLIETEIKSLALDQDELVGGISGGTGTNIQVHRVGYAPFSFFVYSQVYDENGMPIEGAYSDLNGDNIINNEDRYIFEKGAPDLTAGFLSNMSYRGFDFSFNLRAAFGNYVYNNVNSVNAQYDNIQNQLVLANLPTSVAQSGFNTTEDVILSDYFMENASFIRMDNVTLGYTVDRLFTEKLSVRLFAGVQNAFVLTNYTGLDPEVFNNGIDSTIYPRPRSFYGGASFRF